MGWNMSRNDLDKRIKAALMFGFESRDFVNDLIGEDRLKEATQALKALFIEWAEGALPRPYPDPDAKFLETGDYNAMTAQRAYNEALDRVLNNIRGKK